MAVAYAKWTGRLGVCVATSGPGAFHTINGLYDAKMDHQPVVAILGQKALASLGTGAQQESNLERAFADVGAYVQTIVVPEQAQAVVDRACRIALVRKQPTVVILPHDVQAMERVVVPRAQSVSRSSASPTSDAITPAMSEIGLAAEILNSGQRVAFLVGAGARGATDEVLELAERVGAGIITALRGKDVIPADVPYHTQQLGLLGSRPSVKMMEECDTLLMLGSDFPYSDFLPETGQARGVQIDLRPENLGLRYPMELTLWGDVRATLRVLMPMVERRRDRAFQDLCSERMREWRQVVADLAQVQATPVNPRRVFHELDARLPPNAVVTADAGTSAVWYGQHIGLGRGMRGDLSGRLATMLAAMPYAVAAKFAFPDRPVVCTIGDGAFQMLGMNELITVKKVQGRWANRTLVVIVLHNDDLALVSWEMRTQDANPLLKTAQDVEPMDYAGYARALGHAGAVVRSPEEIGPALDAAFAHDGLTVIDVHVDKSVPPLPPEISAEFALHTAAALAKGDPEGWEVEKASANSLLRGSVTKARERLRRDDDHADD